MKSNRQFHANDVCQHKQTNTILCEFVLVSRIHKYTYHMVGFGTHCCMLKCVEHITVCSRKNSGVHAYVCGDKNPNNITSMDSSIEFEYKKNLDSDCVLLNISSSSKFLTIFFHQIYLSSQSLASNYIEGNLK